jgi:hypothetical protein
MTNERLFKTVETGNADEVKKALEEENINTATCYGAKSICDFHKNSLRHAYNCLLDTKK